MVLSPRKVETLQKDSYKGYRGGEGEVGMGE